MHFLYVLITALVVSAIGFKKYVWFISIGYGFSIAAIGVLLLCLYGGAADAGLIIACVLFILYGCRLGGYLTYRELKSSAYNKKMKAEIKDGLLTVNLTGGDDEPCTVQVALRCA